MPRGSGTCGDYHGDSDLQQSENQLVYLPGDESLQRHKSISLIQRKERFFPLFFYL